MFNNQFLTPNSTPSLHQRDILEFGNRAIQHNYLKAEVNTVKSKSTLSFFLPLTLNRTVYGMMAYQEGCVLDYKHTG